MEVDWSVAAVADDPVIETHWSDAASKVAWVDLRLDAEIQRSRIAALPEAAMMPTLARCLGLLNTPQGVLLTTKCDCWQLSDEERNELADALNVSGSTCGFGSYIDVLLMDVTLMASFAIHKEWARLTVRRCAALPIEDARMEIVVRPARRGNVWGYGVTFYCYAIGNDAAHSETALTHALEKTVRVLIAAAEGLSVVKVSERENLS